MFELTDKKRMRIIGFTIKGILMLMGVFLGPWIGLQIYTNNDKNFEESCKDISFIYLFYVAIFILIFFVYFEDELHQVAPEEEEQTVFITEISGEEGNLKDFKKSLKICFKKQ